MLLGSPWAEWGLWGPGDLETLCNVPFLLGADPGQGLRMQELPDFPQPDLAG